MTNCRWFFNRMWEKYDPKLVCEEECKKKKEDCKMYFTYPCKLINNLDM